MNKTPDYQKKASSNYTAKKIKEGYVRVNRWIRPEWLKSVNELLTKLRKEEDDQTSKS